MGGILDVLLPTFVGFVIQVFVFGIGVSQSVYYFRNNGDGWKMYTFVSTLLVLNAASVVLIADILYFYLIANYGNVEALALVDLPQPINTIVVNTVISMVQIFFARQAYLFAQSKKAKAIPVIAVFLSLVAFALGVVAMIEEFEFTFLSELSSTKYQIITTTFAALQALSDVLTVSTMCWQLRSHEEFMKKNRSVIRFLLFCTFNRGLLVVLVQIAFASIPPGNFDWEPLYIPLSGIYMCSCLAMINFRDTIRSKMGTISLSNVTYPTQGIEFAAPPTRIHERPPTDSYTSSLPEYDPSRSPKHASQSTKINSLSVGSIPTLPVIEIVVKKDT